MNNRKINQLVVGAIATNCWIYPFGENEAAIIDPGDEADVIIDALKNLNLTPRYILLTHGHFDHIAALAQLANSKLALEKPQIAIHREDARYIGANAYAAHCLSARAAMVDTSLIDAVLPEAAKQGLPEADRLLEDGDKIGPFTVLHLPGHTPGCAAFWDKEAGVLFTGDTLFKSGYGRTDLPGGNEKELTASLKRLFAMDKNIAVYPGHGGITTIGQEAAEINFFC